MRIDAHHHVWDLAVRDQPWTATIPAMRASFDIEMLRPSLLEHHVDATVVVQTVCVPGETPELLALAAADPHVASVVGWVDLTAADVAEAVARLRAGTGGDTLAGVRHQVQDEPDPQWLLRDDVWRGLLGVAEHDLVYELVVTPTQLAAAVETVRGFPDLRFVLDHAGKPDVAGHGLAAWAPIMLELSREPNVVAKISGLTTEAGSDWDAQRLRPYVEVLLDTFGPGRLMFGSDWPVCLLAGSYDQTIGALEQLTADLGIGEQAAIFGDTAARTYGIGR